MVGVSHIGIREGTDQLKHLMHLQPAESYKANHMIGGQAPSAYLRQLQSYQAVQLHHSEKQWMQFSKMQPPDLVSLNAATLQATAIFHNKSNK